MNQSEFPWLMSAKALVVAQMLFWWLVFSLFVCPASISVSSPDFPSLRIESQSSLVEKDKGLQTQTIGPPSLIGLRKAKFEFRNVRHSKGILELRNSGSP